ncbi:MAG: hypothetical protein JXR20_11590 [Balneola sp.]
MELLPEWAPNIHPLLVHIPIGVIILAALMNFISLFIPEEWWDEKKNTIVYIIGSVSAIGVYYSGKSAADSVFLPTEAQTVLNNHADWALWLVWFFIIYAIVRIGLHYFKLFDKEIIKYITFLAVLPGLFLLYETGEHGAEMVFGYGAGTGQLLEQEEASPEIKDSTVSTESSFTQKENGNWSWEINGNAVTDLIGNFHWTEGSVNELDPEVVASNSSHYLKLSTSEGANTFVTHSNYQNVQVDYYIDMTELDGELMLLHHYLDTDNFDYVSLNSSGVIIQGRKESGEIEIFKEGTFDPKGLQFFRVVGTGTHFRGYVNKEMVVHGHGDAPESGAVGLRMEGEGSILISKIELSQL